MKIRKPGISNQAYFVFLNDLLCLTAISFSFLYRFPPSHWHMNMKIFNESPIKIRLAWMAV